MPKKGFQFQEDFQGIYKDFMTNTANLLGGHEKSVSDLIMKSKEDNWTKEKTVEELSKLQKIDFQNLLENQEKYSEDVLSLFKTNIDFVIKRSMASIL